MASIFDAYAQSYNRAINQEAKLADALRVANMQRQQQEIAQAQEARQAQRFGIELPVLQANAANDVIKANVMNRIFSDPAFQEAVRTGKISAAQATALVNSETMKALENLGPNLPLALGAGYLQNANAAVIAERERALMGNDPQEIKRLFGVDATKSATGWTDASGNILMATPSGTANVNAARMALESARKSSGLGLKPTSSDLAAMDDRSKVRQIDNTIAAQPPVTPVPAVTAQPAFPSVAPVNQTQQPSWIRDASGGIQLLQPFYRLGEEWRQMTQRNNAAFEPQFDPYSNLFDQSR